MAHFASRWWGIMGGAGPHDHMTLTPHSTLGTRSFIKEVDNMIRTKVPMTLIMVIQRRTSIYGELVACQTLCPCFTWSHLISPSHERYENQYWSVLQRKSGSERFLPLNPGSHSWLGVEPGITHKLCDFRNRAPSHSPGPSSKMLHESLCRSLASLS